MKCDAPPLQPKVLHFRIPSGYPGTLRTAAYMAELIRDGARDFRVRRSALEVLKRRAVRAKDYLGEVKALFEWVQQNLRYTKDTFQVEVLHSARRLLELRAGDCDDFSILLGSLLEAIGHPVRLVLTGPNPRQPRLFSHVYIEAFCNGLWIPLDATMPHPMGWSPRTWVKKIIDIHRRNRPMPFSDDALQGAAGAAAVPQSLRDLIRALRGEAIPARDPRVKALWDSLRQRQLLNRSQRLKAVLRRMWQGLPARQRPRTTRHFVHALRKLGVLPMKRGHAPGASPGMQRLRPVVLRRVAGARPAGLRPVHAVSMRPVGR